MNERIKELAVRAGAGVSPSLHGRTDYIVMSKFELDKFAELIIKETMQVVANNLPPNTYLDVADAVIEHFGVEE